MFDGAVGSGQLEQYVNAKHIYGVEIQEQACKLFLENYKNAEVENTSFFNYKSDTKADCVIMNYPFSLKFKGLTEEEKQNIKDKFPWKKSGVVDDIFILQSLEHTNRYGFYICFPGITYRKTEEKLRSLLGNTITELNLIENAFEDTNINVLLLVIGKEKQEVGVNKEIYNCKTKETLLNEFCKTIS